MNVNLTVYDDGKEFRYSEDGNLLSIRAIEAPVSFTENELNAMASAGQALAADSAAHKSEPYDFALAKANQNIDWLRKEVSRLELAEKKLFYERDEAKQDALSWKASAETWAKTAQELGREVNLRNAEIADYLNEIAALKVELETLKNGVAIVSIAHESIQSRNIGNAIANLGDTERKSGLRLFDGYY